MRVLRAAVRVVKRAWLAVLLALSYAKDGGEEPDPF
jgi:hypothetical protein